MTATPKTLAWMGDRLRLLDQRRLPAETATVDCHTPDEAAEAIRNMTVRGAPAIGVTAAFALALAALRSGASDPSAMLKALRVAGETLRLSRPTAVNLAWAVDRVLEAAGNPRLDSVKAIRDAVIREAETMAFEDVEINRRIGRNGFPLVPDGARILHHCNTGALAAVEYGTALGIVRTAVERGKRVHVFVDETRPRLQGARLTAWELGRLGIPYTLITDGAAAFAMKTFGIDLCVVGCDRVASNGDTANKIGTYHLALAAQAHGVPFYVACPVSTIDLNCASGSGIRIEERDADEITRFNGMAVAPADAAVWNPAFDITPADAITAFVTENGIVRPPFRTGLAEAVRLSAVRPRFRL
ncbi:S-methyl-5-thioribose-1-phosphate isomerase [bacterium]|nr:S-methyl-5-thioribose-1-phosphate isomerase [bacterium]